MGIITGSSGSQIEPGWTLAEIVADMNGNGYDGAAFQSWYAAALKKDPSLTPYQGAVVWLGGTAIAGQVGSAAGATGTATGEAAAGSVAGADQAEKDAAGLLPKWSLVFGNTAGLLTRILKVGIGVVLLVAGVLKLSGADKTLKQVLPVVGGPAGKVLMA